MAHGSLRRFKYAMGSVVSTEGPGGHTDSGDGDDGQQQAQDQTSKSAAAESWASWDRSAFKPANVYATMVKNSPKIIGWDDAKFQRLAREAYEEGRRERQQLRRERQLQNGASGTLDEEAEHGSMILSEEEEAAGLRRLGPDERERNILNEIGFGLLGIAADTVTSHLLQTERDDEAQREKKELTTRDSDVCISDSADDALDGDDTTIEEAAERDSAKAMRDTELYKLTLNALRWQRDAYLVGAAYADTRKRQRKLEERNRRDIDIDILSPSLTGAALVPEMSMTMLQAQIKQAGTLNTSNPPLGQTQLIQLGKWFIPSDITKGALLPTVLWLPGPNGPLNLPVSRAVTNIIPMSQSNLDWVVKDSVLWVLKDEAWRNHVKYNMASGYVTQMQQDTSG